MNSCREHWTSHSECGCDEFEGDCIYFVKPEGEDVVKIGITNSIARRLSGLQSGNHRKLHVVFRYDTVPGEDRSEVEAMLHEVFDEHRIRGEWFRIAGNLASMIEKSKDTRRHCPCRDCKPEIVRAPEPPQCRLCNVMLVNPPDAHLFTNDGEAICRSCVLVMQDSDSFAVHCLSWSNARCHHLLTIGLR